MREILRIYLQPAFLICATVLLIAGSAMSLLVPKKVPWPLKTPLALLDQNGLGPYEVVSKDKLDEDGIKSLGTQEYIQWVLEDTDAAPDSAVGKCSLLITYYELADKVPHVPEECYTGTGHQRLASDSVILNCQSSIENSQFSIPVRYLVFSDTKSDYWAGVRFPVLYVFNVNGVYSNSRDDARWELNKNIFSEYVYFSKVEWKFFNVGFGGTIYPSKEEAITASQRLLSVVLPILERVHWPAL